jgi:hypothetical protein
MQAERAGLPGSFFERKGGELGTSWRNVGCWCAPLFPQQDDVSEQCSPQRQPIVKSFLFDRSTEVAAASVSNDKSILDPMIYFA